jgi:hypothetical protein
MLEKNGQPSATLSRIMAFIMASMETGAGTIVAVDSSSNMRLAADLASSVTNGTLTVTTARGAAIGFDLEIGSGSKNNSVGIDAINYHGHTPVKRAAQALLVLHPEIEIDGSESFYNFRSAESFEAALDQADQKIMSVREALESKQDFLRIFGCELDEHRITVTAQTTKGVQGELMHVIGRSAEELMRAPNGHQKVNFLEVNGKALLRAAGKIGSETGLKGMAALLLGARDLIVRDYAAFSQSDLHGVLFRAGYTTPIDQLAFIEKASSRNIHMVYRKTPLYKALRAADIISKQVVAIDSASIETIQRNVGLIINRYLGARAEYA